MNEIQDKRKKRLASLLGILAQTVEAEPAPEIQIEEEADPFEMPEEVDVKKLRKERLSKLLTPSFKRKSDV